MCETFSVDRRSRVIGPSKSLRICRRLRAIIAPLLHTTRASNDFNENVFRIRRTKMTRRNAA
jgi:hypothetical protein